MITNQPHELLWSQHMNEKKVLESSKEFKPSLPVEQQNLKNNPQYQNPQNNLNLNHLGLDRN